MRIVVMSPPRLRVYAKEPILAGERFCRKWSLPSTRSGSEVFERDAQSTAEAFQLITGQPIVPANAW